MDRKESEFHKRFEDWQRSQEDKRVLEERHEREKKRKEAMLFCPKCAREATDFFTKDKDFDDGWIIHTYYYCAECRTELQDGFGHVRVEIHKH
jgi:hypothetical protein